MVFPSRNDFTSFNEVPQARSCLFKDITYPPSKKQDLTPPVRVLLA
jgi:hypothetical protein